MKGHHIITSPGHPWGWDATLQDYDGDNLIGRGLTEFSAVADLIDQLRNIAEAAADNARLVVMRAEYVPVSEKAWRELDPRSSGIREEG